MRLYLDLLRNVLDHGTPRTDRTGVGTRSVFAAQVRFDLSAGFPLLTTKRVHLKSVIHELLWFISGQTNIAPLQAAGVRIWNEWADADGELGPVYGHQWRRWANPDGSTSDQLSNVVQAIRDDPYSRRLVVSAWNVSDLPRMALPPCHLLFQFWVQDGRLSCQLYQRSADLGLGVPFNVASYALLTMMVAQVTGLQPGEFIWNGGDCHIYETHLEQVKVQLARQPRPLPTMHLNPAVTDLFAFRYEDFRLEGYDPHPGLPMVVAV